MKPAVNSKKLAIIPALVVGGFSFYWYFNPFPWLGVIMGIIFGSLVYFTLSTRNMERLRRTIFIGFFVLAWVAVIAIILDAGTTTFMSWVRLASTEYYLQGQPMPGSSSMPDTRLIPQTLLGNAYYAEGVGWVTRFASSPWGVFMYMVPYFMTVLILGRSICGWLCPYGGLSETFVTGKKERWSLNMFKRRVTTKGGVHYAGLKNWVYHSKYGLLLAVILLSIIFSFPLISIFSPWLWLKSTIIFWLVMAIIFIFMIFLPFMTKRRWWCLICPVGAAASLFNKASLFRIKIDKNKCIKCNDCVQECRMYAITPRAVEFSEAPNSNCIRCGRCIEICPEEAVDYNLLGTSIKTRAWLITLSILAISAWGIWFVIALADILQRLL